MKKSIIISSLNANLYTTKRLMDEALKLKHSPIWLNPYEHTLPSKLKPRDGFFLHRTTGTNYDDFDLVVSQYYEMAGMQVSNSIDALKNFRSKDTQHLFFLKNNLPEIPTLLYRGSVNKEFEKELLKLNIAHSQGPEYVLKMNRGNQGIGVNFIKGKKSLFSFLETFKAMRDQRFILEAHLPHRREWRLFIIRGEIVACIEKLLKKNEFRGNAKRSHAKNLVKIPTKLSELALRAFLSSQLDYAGIDILESESGELFILEINAVAGFEHAEELSGKNIARELLNFSYSKKENTLAGTFVK